MNRKINAAIVATVVSAVMSAGAAEAMNLFSVPFSYTFSNQSEGIAEITGTIVGEIDGDRIINLDRSRSSAQFTLSLGGLNAPNTPVELLLTSTEPFTLDTASSLDLDLQFIGVTGQSSYSIDRIGPVVAIASFPSRYDILDTLPPFPSATGFGTFTTGTPVPFAADTPVPVPTPALLPGIMTMGVAIRRRLSSQA